MHKSRKITTVAGSMKEIKWFFRCGVKFPSQVTLNNAGSKWLFFLVYLFKWLAIALKIIWIMFYFYNILGISLCAMTWKLLKN